VTIGWDDERVALLRKLWPDCSASQIAKQLGGVTRNAVIGKAHRLGLTAKAPPRIGWQPPADGRSFDASKLLHPLDRRR
jgi:hypothetical protein